jgi:hypothetical protein
MGGIERAATHLPSNLGPGGSSPSGNSRLVGSGERSLALLAYGSLIEAASGVLEIAGRSGSGTSVAVYYGGWVAMVLGIVLMVRGLGGLRLAPRRHRGTPWRLLQIIAGAMLVVCGWLGRHVRRVRRRYFLPWSVASLTAIGLSIVATVEVERIDARRRTRPYPWRGLSLWLGGTLASVALLGLVGTPGPVAGPFTPLWLAAPVGGIVVLVFGLWFLSLTEALRPRTGRWGGWFATVALGWALGVSVLGGWVVGPRALAVLVDFFTNWAALAVVIAPFVDSIAFLFVAYLLVATAAVSARRRPHAEPVLGTARKDPSSAG